MVRNREPRFVLDRQKAALMLSSSVPQALLALAFVLMLAYGGQIVFRRIGPFGFERPHRAASNVRLVVRSSLALDPRRRLLILSCDEREALLLVSATAETFLGWLPSRDCESSGKPSP